MDIGLLVSIVVGVLLVLMVTFGFLALLSRSRQAAAVKLRPKPTQLTEAEKLLEQNQPAFAVQKAFAAVEGCLKERVGQVGTGTAFDMLKAAESKGVLSNLQVNKAHNLRILRNKIIHEQGNAHPQAAEQAVSDAKIIISGLGYKI